MNNKTQERETQPLLVEIPLSLSSFLFQINGRDIENHKMLPINREIYGHENVLPVRSIDQKKIRIRPKKIVLISRTEQSYEIRSFVLNCQMMMLNKKLRSNISKMFNSPLFIFGRRYGRLMPHCFWASLLFLRGGLLLSSLFFFFLCLKNEKKQVFFFILHFLSFVCCCCCCSCHVEQSRKKWLPIR